ncbi:MAG: FKBP-type peptidyl-prolyl cis-trans isomerase N-terminal domain-containing protein [Paludibacter sp.]
MKKQSILSLVALVAIFLLTSCNKYEAKTAELKTQNDSLNYTLGLANGDGIKMNMMQKDSSDKAIVALMEALDKAYKSGADKDELYKLGVQIGNSFKQQKAKGLMGDSTLVFNSDLVKQGLVNALNGFKDGMTTQQAQEYIQKTMMEIQTKKMGQQPQMSAPQQEAPQEAPQQEVK